MQRTNEFEAFTARFRYDPSKAFWVGVEREAFLADENGDIAPIAPEVLRRIQGEEYGYELSACQLETRVGPCPLEFLPALLMVSEDKLIATEQALGFHRIHKEVGPEDMPLDVYPDPAGRYAKIAACLDRETLRAACRVIGTHIHIGMQSPEAAMEAYEGVRESVDELCTLGDGSEGERLRLYKQMAPDWQPPRYGLWTNFYRAAVEKGFVNDPRQCWTLIRLSVHGTIEFRIFGATDSIGKIVAWAERCHALCETAAHAVT